MQAKKSISIKLIPFVRLLLPLLAGILLQINIPLFSKETAVLIGIISFVLFIIAHYLFTKFSTSFISGFFIFIFLFFLGVTITIFNNPIHSESLPNDGILVAQVIQQPVKKGKSVKILLQINGFKNHNRWQSANTRIIAYFRDSSALDLHIGNTIVISSPTQPIQAPKNPHEFDYRKYLAYHLISHQTFIRPNQWHRLSNIATTGSLQLWFSHLREHIIKNYKQAGIKGNNLAILSALTVGNKDFLTSQIKQSFASTGAMHVLAVSGLHVGIIYLFLNFILFFLKKRFQWLRAILIVLSLWFYAFLSGLPPSIVRAAFMFSFIIIGESINRHQNIYNTIAASAFFILIINPYHILSIGFWLSYSAVLGIIYFYPIFYKRLYFGKSIFGKILDYLWALICVSIAAQIATFPVALYFFHQFPTWFILTNIFIIPVVTIIMFSSFLFLLLTPISFFQVHIGIFLNHLLNFQYSGIQFLSKLPYETINNIHISLMQFILLYLITLFFAFFLSLKKSIYLHLILSAFIVFVGLDTIYQQHTAQQRKFIVYAIPKASAYNFIDGNDNILFSSLLRNDGQIQFHLKNNWLSLGLKDEKLLDISTLKPGFFFRNYLTIDNPHFFWKRNFLQFYDKRIIVFNTFFNDKNLSPNYILPVDYIVISDNVSVSIKHLKQLFRFKTIIFDNSNSSFYVKRKIAECKKYKVPYYSTNQGAFMIDV